MGLDWRDNIKNTKDIRVAFFTEAGYSRGMGHIVRSFTIGDKFKSLGIKTFLFLDSDESFDDKFDDLNYFSWKDFKLTKDYDAIFIDSYEADIDVYHKIAKACKLPVYLDDFKRLDYPSGVVINFAPESDTTYYKYRQEKHTYLLGLKYMPIRSEFLTAEVVKKEKIFIMLGGSDTANLSLELLHSLKDVALTKQIVTNDRKILNSLKKYDNVEILYKPSNLQLVESMASSSIAISTASMSAYELAYLKIPTIIIAVAKNQEIGLPLFIKNNIALDFVSIENKNWQDDLMNKVKFNVYKKNHNINQLIDGKGTENIVHKILELIK
jgi:UDP-2,4-diacetamido-2,4,6-trideoxy-beta-L-altropyranose hydrolase